MEDRNVRRGDIYHADLDPVFTMKQKLPGSQKKRKLPLIKLLIVYFELNWQAYAATIGASQPSVFNFFRYAFILRSLLN